MDTMRTYFNFRAISYLLLNRVIEGSGVRRGSSIVEARNDGDWLHFAGDESRDCGI
jgi:hypothetical protein